MRNRPYSIILVNAPIPSKEQSSGNYSAFPALGIITLGTQIQKYFGKSVDISVLDGSIHSFKDILAHIDFKNPDMIGISVLTPTYPEGLKIAEYAKAKGAVTVLGADHACFFPHQILARRHFIDYIVQAEGGEAPLTYLVGRMLGKGPNPPVLKGKPEKIFSRINGSAIELASFPRFILRDTYKDAADIPNLNLIRNDLELLAENYNRLYGSFHKSPRKPVVINNQRGCSNAHRRCIYCSIWNLNINTGSSNFFWQTIRKYHKEHGINFFFEVSDNFFSSLRYIQELIRARPFDPKKHDIEFEIYARANDIINNKNSIEYLKRLNITRVNLGLDSGDDTILAYLRKGNHDKANASKLPVQINYEAVKKLAEADISIHASFPLGGLGETKNSLNNTGQFIERIISDFPHHIATLEASELVPMPHSPSWDMLLSAKDKSTFSLLANTGIELPGDTQEHLKKKYAGKDLLDVKELAKDWAKYFTHITFDDIERTKRNAARLAKKIGANYGRAI